MLKFLSFFENFAFRAFNFSDRATRLEYWCVMPAVWLIILGTLTGDVMEFWGFLLARQVPPLNPFYYESILFFLLTIIPRLSLTVRRLHDSGKSGKWIKLPIISVTSGAILFLGLGSAFLTSGMANNPEGLQSMAMLGVFAAIWAGQSTEFWEMAYGAAAFLNAIGLDAIWAVLAELQAPKVDVGTGLSTVSQGLQQSPLEGTQLIVITMFMVATPFVSALLHLYFMLLPSDLEENSFGQTTVKPAKSAPKGKPAHNPMEGYAHLFEKTPEQLAQHKAAQQAELKSLYRTRVLRQPENP